MEELKGQQKKVFEFIRNYIEQNNNSPSIREICEGVKLSSSATVHGHLMRLEKKGYIIRTSSKNRCINLSKQFRTEPVLNIPIVGNIAAGIPIESPENFEGQFPIPLSYFPGDNLFMLKVQGESMINAGILDGDMIIVKKCEDANNGEIVIAMVNNEATVKRFYKEKKHIRLQPENDTMEAIIVQDAAIVGKMVGLIRKY